MPSSDFSGNTQTQILDTAERLFAEQGFAATSLRSIIRTADVNLAAVHYHFGSKDKLILAAIQRMAQPIAKSQTEQLASAKEKAEGQDASLSVEAIFRAMIAPALEKMYLDKAGRGLIQAQFMGRCWTEPAIEPLASEEFSKSQKLFVEAFQQVLPHVSEIEIKWKLDFSISMLVRVLCAAYRPTALLQGNSPEEIEQAIDQLVKFASAGMKA